MHDSEPGLFDLPDPEPKAPPLRPPRGRNRETWARTATAEVTIIDAAALNEAVARAEANGVMINVSVDSGAEDPPRTEPEAKPADRAFNSLARLIWPTDGLDALLEAGAFRIVSVDSEVVDESPDRGTATWTVTVKLSDIDRLRRLAAQAHPDEAAVIANSLAVAWEHAADPFAPLRSIPGIAWRPVKVVVEHLPARTALGVR